MSSSPRQSYEQLIALSKEHAVLSSCIEVLYWDADTFMPRGGVQHRGAQLAALAGLVHEFHTSPRVADLLAAVEGSDLTHDPESPEGVNIRELSRQHQLQSRLPRRLVEEKARMTAVAQQVWAEAKEENDYARFQPVLDQVLALGRSEGEALAGGKEGAYDALLGQWEPGATAAHITALFESLCAELRPILNAITASRKRPRAAVLKREYNVEKQKLFVQSTAATLGFDLTCGRIDVGAHPTCIYVGPGDVRITNRYAERDFSRGFFCALHETGHGLYDQGLSQEHFGTPMGDAPSLGMHEGQARMWENFVGRGLAFWKHFHGRLREVFPEAVGEVTLESFHAAVNRVEPTLNRPESDEVTYNLHIAIRFELEQALFSGALATGDLPGAWKEAYRRHLGIEPANDAEGCLQDGHWSAGMFGYFPTYTLGNIYAAQLYAAARAALPGLDESFAEGDFSLLVDWLRDNVYRHGHRWTSAELIRRVTGSGPDNRPLIEHLRARYGPVYGF